MHAVDDLADAGPNAGQAAKIVVLVTKPLSLNPKKFDPDGDGAANLRHHRRRPAAERLLRRSTRPVRAIAKRILGKVSPETIATSATARRPAAGGTTR
jgi:hypothetical protein